MTEFNKESSIVGQNAGSTAAVLMSAFVGASGAQYQGLDDFLADYNAIRTDVMNGSIALAGAEGFIEAFGEAPKSAPARSFGGNGGSKPRSTGGGGGGGSNQDPGTLEVNFGKYRGKTLAEVYATDQEYMTWLEENTTNDWFRGKVSEFLAAA